MAQDDEEELFPILSSGIGSALYGERRAPIEYSTTVAGPLVALDPVARLLGGVLEPGPLGSSARLTLGPSTFVFGTESSVVSEGERLFYLRQPALRGAVGLRVPVELLEESYGRLEGFEFRWRDAESVLEISRRAPRELAVSLESVNLQGVTTLVFRFSSRPHYEVERSGDTVAVRFTGDRLRFDAGRSDPRGALVREVTVESDAIRIRLAPNVVAKDYLLADPFRLVFDVYQGSSAAPVSPAPRVPRRTEGLTTIVIDPGHGGEDTGATGPDGSLEKNLTLILARTLKRQLQTRLPVKVVLTRDSDVEMPLDTRAALANQHKADLFISLHLNSSVAAGAKGAETYFLSLEASDERAARSAETENRPASSSRAEGDPLWDLELILWDLAQNHHLAESQRIAALIQEELNLTLELRNRGVKQAPFRVLMGAAMPAVLVELGFLTNREEEKRLNDPEYRVRLADTLVRAVSRYRASLVGDDEVAAAGAGR
ncbi:MAG: N-acetylmuramoyl-L-alanine amidase [Thermoanaerobaculia bacterium]|nr:N-acetylmuramoyl-L-alanine amidase [Thermoanaerobaculia bacterium]